MSKRLDLEIRHKEIWQLYLDHRNMIWFPTKTFTEDLKVWDKVPTKIQNCLKEVITMFNVIDGCINKNIKIIMNRHISELPENMDKEVEVFYDFQITIENIHAETYNLMTRAFIGNEKATYEEIVRNKPVVNKICQFVINDMENVSFGKILLRNACTEGILISGIGFVPIFWVTDDQGYDLPTLKFYNQYIARDEGIHRDFACYLKKELEKFHSYNLGITIDDVMKTIHDTIDISKEFAIDFVGDKCNGLSVNMIDQYCQHVADILLVNLGYPKFYKQPNPLMFMEKLNLVPKTNFFEKYVSDYVHEGAVSENNVVTTNCEDEDF